MKVFGVILSSMLAFACGQEQQVEQPVAKDQPANTSEKALGIATAVDDGAQSQKMIVVKVPVDANGEELTAEAEYRMTSQEDSDDLKGTVAAFDGGSELASTDELDQDSSTESLHRWTFFWGSLGRGISRSFGWGRNAYLGYRGLRYNYRYRSAYRYGYRSGYRYGYGANRYNYYTYCGY
jgi:hypothetical protein